MKKSISFRNRGLLDFALHRAQELHNGNLSAYLSDLVRDDMLGLVKHKSPPEGRLSTEFVWEGVVIRVTQTRESDLENEPLPVS